MGEGADAMVELSAGLGRLVYPTAPGATGKRWVTAGSSELRLEQLGLAVVEHGPILCTGRRPFVLSDPTATPAGFWPQIPDVAEWEREQTAVENLKRDEIRQAQRLEAAAAQKVLDIAAAVEGAPAYLSGLAQKFVNPYTFVPWPMGDLNTRAAPAGHAALLPGRFSGTFEIHGTTVTPLLIGTGSTPGRFPRRRRNTSSGEVAEELVIPGSSLKGAFRSLHETLAGGCLRVAQLDFLPVYRDPPVGNPRLKMALIGTIDSYGIPENVTLCDKVVHVEPSDLQAALGTVNQVRTGAQVSVNDAKTFQDVGRFKAGAGAVTAGNRWVVLITDSAARSAKNPYYAAVGRIGTHMATVSTEAWRGFEKAVEGAFDVSTGQQAQHQLLPTAEVHFPHPAGNVIGERNRAMPHLSTGDVVWVQLDEDGNVGRILLSYLWRNVGEGALIDRVPKWARPCSHAGDLCVSCRLFGSADTDHDDESEEADQQSYAGHVRISDAQFSPCVTVENKTIAAMGAPRLGAGQFSLQTKAGVPRADKLKPALRNWGSARDANQNRLVRGRKYYWQGDPVAQNPPRYAPYLGGAGGEGHGPRVVEVVSPGSAFQTVVRFENLDLAELGALLASIDPSQVLRATEQTVPLTEIPIPGTGNPKIAGRLGGGKPFGFGAVDFKVANLVMHSALSRYCGEPLEERVSQQNAVEKFVASAPSAVKDTWPDIAACLQMHHVDPSKIAYPPAAAWGHADRAAYASNFWKNSNGDNLSDLVSLPGPPRNADQYLTIVPGH